METEITESGVGGSGEADEKNDIPMEGGGGTAAITSTTTNTTTTNPTQITSSSTPAARISNNRHALPLRLLAIEEEYVVNDVLGVTNPTHPDIEHIRVPHATDSMGDIKMLHSTSRQDSFAKKSGNSLNALGGSNAKLNKEHEQKKVGFAPEPPSYS